MSDIPGPGADPAHYLAFAHELADAAGREILPRFRAGGEVTDKGVSAFDPVTEADRAAEAAMRALVKARHPTHGLVGEEYGTEAGSSDLAWVFDPIDGTRAFIAGLPVWGTLIALTERGRPILGVLDQPVLGERFVGFGGRAVMRQRGGAERALHVRPTEELSRAVLCSTTPDMFDARERPRFQEVAARARLVRYGTDCYAYGMLAAGFVDLVVEASLKPFDILAHIPIIEGAGGIVTDWDGRPAYAGGRCIAAASRALHAEALLHLRGL